jgi:hypothetical protein
MSLPKNDEEPMPFLGRNEISWNERYRRCFYFFLRDELDALLVNESLVKSYSAFRDAGKEYPFVEMRELKPRARIISPESPEHRHFMAVFNEEAVPPECKNHIRFFDSNKVTKDNVASLAPFDLRDVFQQRMRFFDDTDFPELLTHLLESDFAVLIQRDQTLKSRYRFALSHFHVRIDWPVADAAADLARHLRYISKDLYEKGERAAEVLQQKLYEYYGFHHSAGGRRTAALVAKQFMAQFDFISTVYVASAEARTMYRLSESGIQKYVLIPIAPKDLRKLARSVGMRERQFVSTYLLEKTPEYGVGVFVVTYKHNEHSLPPPDGKLRELNADYSWLRVDLQLLVPPPSSRDARPIPYSRVYM